MISYTIVCTISDTVINLKHDIAYDISIRYRIRTTDKCYVLILSLVCIMPLIYLNGLLKWYSWWNQSFQRIWTALQCQVQVFWSHVHPIWHFSQELCNRSRFGIRELPSRNILVHVITKFVKIHFVVFIASRGRQARSTWSCFELKINSRYRYRMRYRVPNWGRFLEEEGSLPPLISKPFSSILKKTTSVCRHDIQFQGSLPPWYRSVSSISGMMAIPLTSSRQTNSFIKRLIRGKHPAWFDFVNDIGAMSGYYDIKNLWISYALFRRYIRYSIPGAAGRTGHVPTPPTGTASWSSTRLYSLYSFVIVFTPFSAAAARHTPQKVEFSCLLRHCPGMDCWPVTVGSLDFRLSLR